MARSSLNLPVASLCQTLPSLGRLRCVKRSPLSRPVGAQHSDATRRPKLDLAIRGGCDMRSCRRFRGLL
eukprot:7748308-Pyramimonas_sp.AAC.1